MHQAPTCEEFINRIKWDDSWKKEEFMIFYVDRMLGLQELTFSDILIIRGGWMLCSLEYGTVYIPLHRVRKITRNGEEVWSRAL